MENQNNEMQLTFEWHSLLRDLLRNCWLVVLAGMIAWMGLYVANRSVYEPTYTSTAVLAVRTRIGSYDTYATLSTSSDMAEILTRVFTQPSMRERAAANLGKPAFEGSISASVMGSTNLMRLSVTADHPETAYRQLWSVLQVYPTISEHVFADAVIDVMENPFMPVGPSNSMPRSRESMIILLAMLLECGGIVALSLLRNTVKTEKSFKNQVDAKLLGSVVHCRPPMSIKERMKGKKRAILINNVYTDLKFCEDYQKIATRLEFLKHSPRGQVLTITSVAENEGKSTAAVNLALALANRGCRVALLDLDVRKPAIYKMLGFRQKLDVNLADVLSGEADPENLKLRQYRKTGLMLGLNQRVRLDTARWISGERTRAYLEQLRKEMDYILLDTPPASVSADAVALAAISDATVLLVRTDVVAAEDINDAIVSISNAGGHLAGCVLNDVYRSFTLFGQMGVSEVGYTGYRHRYAHYGSYGGYGGYQSYNQNQKYGKYGNLSSEQPDTVRKPENSDRTDSHS